MLDSALEQQLTKFRDEYAIRGKGPLCVALVVTRHAKDLGLPLDPAQLLAESRGQVKGLGKAAVQGILKAHDISGILAHEGGRTSRGSVANMQAYVSFLNQLCQYRHVDLDDIEDWWVEQVREFFRGQPFLLHLDPGKSVRHVIQDLIGQADRRQSESGGLAVTGVLLQHLVGAKLAILIGNEVVQHGASVADQSTGRIADFDLPETAIHVTTAPTEGLLRKCRANAESGRRPVIITIAEKVAFASTLALQEGIQDRVDVLDIEQFLAANLLEHSGFRSDKEPTAARLIDKYNEIVDSCETDPSLRIQLRR